jgi:outer membrane protein assembly factor BamB
MTIRSLPGRVLDNLRASLIVAVAITGALAPVTVARLDTGASTYRSNVNAFRGSNGHTGAFPVIGPQSLNLKYFVTADDDVNASVAVGSDGTAYMASRDGAVRAISAAGVELWKSSLGASTEGAPVLTPDGQLLILGDQKGRVKAWNAKTGDGAWVTPSYGQVLGPVTVGARGRIWFASTDQRLIALDPDGSLHRTVILPADSIGSPAISADNSIYVATVDNRLRKYSPDGDQLFATDLPYSPSTAPVVAENSAVTLGVASEVIRVDGSNGAIVWRKSLGVRIRSMPAVSPDGNAYIGVDDGRVVAIGPNGNMLWSAQTGGAVISAPAVDQAGTVYVGSGDAILYAFDRSGARVATYRAFDAIDSPITIAPDGTVFAGSRDNRLYAIRDDLRRFTSSPADRVGGDLIRDRGTGRVYAILNGTRRWIPDPVTLERLGLGSRVPRALTEAEIGKIVAGPDLPALTEGSVIRSTTGASYRIVDGQRTWIPEGDPNAVDAPDQVIRSVALVVSNGAAIKGTDDRVYVVENGFRRWVESAVALRAMGISWSAVHLVTDAYRDSVPVGLPIS